VWSRAFKRLLGERNLTQNEVAVQTGIDKNTLSALVHGRPTKTTTLERLAEFFKVNIVTFFLQEGEFVVRPHVETRDPRAMEMTQAVVDDLTPLISGLVVRYLEQQNQRGKASAS
jgi:transcriptional regulator with XRE-family HTH domain